jgi:hypothetical protein
MMQIDILVCESQQAWGAKPIDQLIGQSSAAQLPWFQIVNMLLQEAQP